MSGHQIPAGGADARSAFPTLHAPKFSIRAEHSHWRLERLTEARGVLADIAHHPDTLVLLASQVICTHSPDPDERTDALGVMRLLNACPLDGASTAPNGGAA